MDRKGLCEMISRYWQCRTLLTTQTRNDAEAKLSKARKHSFLNELMSQELKWWLFIEKIDNLVGTLPKREREFMFSVLRVNTNKSANVSQIAKETGISEHCIRKNFAHVLNEMNGVER